MHNLDGYIVTIDGVCEFHGLHQYVLLIVGTL
jgi:hypothetical protein